ncbi:MAG: hypothetical protein ACYCV0_08470 [Desulfitobacteriaceae bacterium]
MDLTPSMTAIVPGLGSVVAGADGEIGFDDGLRDWDASGLLAVAGAVCFIGAVSATGSGSEALFSAEIISGGASSAFVMIPAFTAGFSGSVGKSSDLGAPRPHGGTQCDTGGQNNAGYNLPHKKLPPFSHI